MPGTAGAGQLAHDILHGGQAYPPADIPRRLVELGGIPHPKQHFHGPGGDSGAVVRNGKAKAAGLRLYVHPDGAPAPVGQNGLRRVGDQVFQYGQQPVVLPDGEVPVAAALQMQLVPAIPQKLPCGHLQYVQQVGQVHGLMVVSCGHVLLQPPDNAQIVLLHLMDVPGNGQGQGVELPAGLFLLQLLIKAVGVGHDPFDVLRVLFQKIELGFQAGCHQEETAVALFVL